VNGEAAEHEPTQRVVEVPRQYLGSEPVRGENPQIFRYRIRHEEAGPSFALAAQFYEAFEIFAFSSKELHEDAA
jgi:hypothetical protein